MKKLVALAMLFAATLSFAQTTPEPNGWEKLPAPTGVVTDYEHLFTDKEILTLTDLITKFEKQTTIEINVVTINPELTPKERFEEFTKYIASHWGVDKKGMDKGILIGISKGYHRIRIQNGDGVKTLISDDETYRIVQGYFIPKFKENDYFGGTKAGIEGLMVLLKEKM